MTPCHSHLIRLAPLPPWVNQPLPVYHAPINNASAPSECLFTSFAQYLRADREAGYCLRPQSLYGVWWPLPTIPSRLTPTHWQSPPCQPLFYAYWPHSTLGGIENTLHWESREGVRGTSYLCELKALPTNAAPVIYT